MNFFLYFIYILSYHDMKIGVFGHCPSHMSRFRKLKRHWCRLTGSSNSELTQSKCSKGVSRKLSAKYIYIYLKV